MLTLFLDIDGVLATGPEFLLTPKSKTWNSKYNVYPFNHGCVEVLNEILKFADGKIQIVLSSDWRLYFSLEEMQDIFDMNGVIQGPIGFTSRESASMDHAMSRINQIYEYVKQEGISKFFVIDDLDLKCRVFSGRFFHTPRYNEGIKQSGVKEKILKFVSEKL